MEVLTYVLSLITATVALAVAVPFIVFRISKAWRLGQLKGEQQHKRQLYREAYGNQKSEEEGTRRT